MLVVFETPIILTGEGLVPMLLGGVYGKALVGLLISFFFSLGFAGRQAYLNLKNKEKLLSVSFMYSGTVNLIIWSTFILITILDNLSGFQWSFLIIPPIFIAVFCTFATTVTIGLLICYKIKRTIQKHESNNTPHNTV